MKHVEYAYTRGMDESEVEERLRTTRTGVLALSNHGDAYAIPLAHHYDGDALYFRLGFNGDSKKREFMEATETATYVLYGTETTDDPREMDSWSIVISGTLRELTADEKRSYDTAEINQNFSPIRVFDEEIDDIDIEVVELVIDSITGRVTPTQ
jgi:nitroimidazol reductase NimA-like FMN-containing flavoprotein (pyridoxamine 5'-phosphate oxidase superfamily)